VDGVGSSAVPAAPRLRSAFRAAGSDLYFNSWRLVPANLLWSTTLIGLLLLPVPWLVTLLLLPILGLPTALNFRLATLIVRGDAVALSDGFDRRLVAPGLLLSAGVVLAFTVFVVNIASGVATGEPMGWMFATVAGWSLVFVWVWSLVVWPVVIDPRRLDEPLRDRLRLGTLLVLAFPLRLAALALVITLMLAVSTVLFAALLTISVAYAALVSARYVLPAADRLEGRATVAASA
jgi:hypothetical protein